MKVALYNNGCVNEMAMMSNFYQKIEQYGIERAKSLDECDYLVYITCAGTGDKIAREINDILLFSEEHSSKKYKVIVVGCLLNKLKVDYAGLKDNSNIKFINNKEWVLPVINYIADMKKRNTYKESLNNKTRLLQNNTSIQFILQEGCNNHCTFCKTNYLNTKLKSIPFELALDHLKKMVKSGTKIISLNGENTTLYGLDLYREKRLHEFIHELSKTEGLELIYIGELVAGDMYPELIDEIITNPKVVATSLQLESASNRLLKMMNRNYTIEEYDYYAKKIINSGKYIETILISGFPTETTEDMDYTLNYLKDRKILTSLMCEYSDFKLIPSSNYEQYSKSEKRKHTKYFTDRVKNINYDIYLSEIDKQQKLIHLDYNNVHIFTSNIPGIFTISKSNKYNNLEPGSIIYENPKILVKKNNLTKEMTYKL